ncbi:MerR family transcriptional regulator [Nocardioides nematodiphilus]|uniref:MerR family transcriptional regulator n=1 Tax=Nocardioides nematodiphilus TaxID=2849669 RepID=UPI001CD9395D|nr:MerR family transcriptional regulator [Nocardioides nematodiphilus]MCA1983497.1 MerR family transcriptional regulator [Nocardioides nematodiphilus]
MLTISQLASYAGVTVRAVRHYHATGLLPEPERDHSGYRRYDAAAVVELIRIRTLAEAGVPLSRVQELLGAGPEEFAAAVEEIDRRLRAEIREAQQHRARIAQLAAGESLALPPEAVAYLDGLRALGVPEMIVEAERDAWILVAAQLPEEMPFFMQMKQAQLEDDGVRELYLAISDVTTWDPDDPRVEDFVDQLAKQFKTVPDVQWDADPLTDDLAALLDGVFLDSVPAARRILHLLEDRGWTGWTKIRPL